MKTITIVALITITTIFTIQSVYAVPETCEEQPPIVTSQATNSTITLYWTEASQCDDDTSVYPRHYVATREDTREKIQTNDLYATFEGLDSNTEYTFQIAAAYRELHNQFVEILVITSKIHLVTEKTPNGIGCNDCTPPTLAYNSKGIKQVDNGICINSTCLDAGYFHTNFPMQKTLTYFPNTVSLTYYENQGPSNIKLVQLGIGTPEIGSPINNSQAIIEVYLNNFKGDIYNPSIEEIKLIDPDGIIYFVTAQVELVPCMEYALTSCLKTDFNYSYVKPPSSIVLVSNAIDYSKNTFNNYFNDGLDVVYYTP